MCCQNTPHGLKLAERLRLYAQVMNGSSLASGLALLHPRSASCGGQDGASLARHAGRALLHRGLANGA